MKRNMNNELVSDISSASECDFLFGTTKRHFCFSDKIIKSLTVDDEYKKEFQLEAERMFLFGDIKDD